MISPRYVDESGAMMCWAIGIETGATRDGKREIALLVTVHQSPAQIAHDICRYMLVSTDHHKMFVSEIPAGSCDHRIFESRHHRWFEKAESTPEGP